MFTLERGVKARFIDPEKDADACWNLISQPYCLDRLLNDYLTLEVYKTQFYKGFKNAKGFIFKDSDESIFAYISLEQIFPLANAVELHGASDLKNKNHLFKIAMDFTLKFLFDRVGVNKVEMHTYIPNLSVSHLAKSNGFKLEGTMANRVVSKGKLYPLKVFGLTREMFYGLF